MVVACPGKRPFLWYAVALGAAFASSAALADQTSPQKRQTADEQEMLTKAREEADERRRAMRPKLEGTVSMPTVSMPLFGARSAGEPADASGEALKREAELQRLSDKLRRANQLQQARAPKVDTPWATEVSRALPDAEGTKPVYRAESRSALGHRAAAEAAQTVSEDRATVLLVMTPGRKGIRRFEKTADPILCSNDGCYVSNGPDTSARYISLRRSLGVINTLGPRAGACRQTTGCVFRAVDVSASNAILQPVDLKVLVHDRRAIKPALMDDTCRVDAGRLSCDKPLRGDDFVMWVIPESVAARAGSNALRLAVEDGLTGARRAALQD